MKKEIPVIHQPDASPKTMRTTPFVWLLCAILTAPGTGCVKLAPHYNTPPLPVAPKYPEDAPTTTGGAPVTKAWRDYFAEPRLQELIATALENNRDLRMAALHVQEARAEYGIQRAELFPTVDASAYGIGTRIPALNAVNLTYKSVGLGITAWELDFWGRLRNLKEAALQNFFASEQAQRAATVSLIAEVADAYFTLRELDERIRLARQTITTREDSFRIFSRRVEVGSTSRLDLQQVEVLLREAQSLDTELGQERAFAAHALAALVGTQVDLPVSQEQFTEKGVLQELRAGLPSDLLTSRPDIIEAEHELRAAHADIGAARAAFFPQVTLTGSGGTASAVLSGLFSSPSLFAAGSAAWNFLPSISVPIFDAGRNRNNLNLAEVRRNSAVANYEKTIQGAFRDVADALSAQHWLSAQIEYQEATLGAETERARLAQMRYDNGSASYLEVLDAQREVLSAQQQLVQVRRAFLSSRVRLYAALGGGA